MNDDVENIVQAASKTITKWKRKSLEQKMQKGTSFSTRGMVVLSKENQDAADGGKELQGFGNALLTNHSSA